MQTLHSKSGMGEKANVCRIVQKGAERGYPQFLSPPPVVYRVDLEMERRTGRGEVLCLSVITRVVGRYPRRAGNPRV